MLRLLMLLALILPAAARDCGRDTACTVAGGDYLMAVPPGPLKGAVIFLHGHGGTGEGTLANAAMVAALAARGHALIAPTALPRQPGGPTSWNSTADPARRDDVAYLRAVAGDAGKRLGIDPAAMLLAGFSGGGMMVWRVACDAPGAFAAHAPVAGLLWRPLPEGCAGPVRMLHVHGWTDRVVPLEGRTVGGGVLTQGDLFAGLALLRRASACRDAPDAVEFEGEALIRRWTSCAPGASLALALHPGGHMVPPGWADMALDWLAGLPRPRSAAPTPP